jgi:hypothetical protein
MENTKLTVRVPVDVLQRAKQYAQEHDTTLTRLISEYLRQLPLEGDPLAQAPIVRRMSGLLSSGVSIDDYKAYLEEKYGHPTAGADRS